MSLVGPMDGARYIGLCILLCVGWGCASGDSVELAGSADGFAEFVAGTDKMGLVDMKSRSDGCV